MLDAMGGLEFLVDGIVVGVTEYINMGSLQMMVYSKWY